MTLHFNLEHFGSNNRANLILQGDATFDDKTNVLLLTSLDDEGQPLGASVGRALWSDPLHLYDSHGRLTGFETKFNFRITKPQADYIPGPGDGLAFFITDTEIPNDSFGKYLGIYRPSGIVAVEFDTFPNPEEGDPPYKHVGININSIRSSTVAQWTWLDGKIATATIRYNSALGRLSVEAHYPDGTCVTLSHDIKLNTILPERVRVGLTASTGQFSQKNEVLSWIFRSN